jgi:hypothetical protein
MVLAILPETRRYIVEETTVRNVLKNSFGSVPLHFLFRGAEDIIVVIPEIHGEAAVPMGY